MIKDLEYLAPLGRSDHSIIKFTVACYAEPKGPRIQVCYDRGNYEKFNKIINDVNWDKEFSEYPDDVDKQFDYFEKVYKQAENECIPKKKFILMVGFRRNFRYLWTRKQLQKLNGKTKFGAEYVKALPPTKKL